MEIQVYVSLMIFHWTWNGQFSVGFNGKAHLIHNNFGQGLGLFTDACLKGYGLVCGQDWQAGNVSVTSMDAVRVVDPVGLLNVSSDHGHWWNVPIRGDVSINYLELVAIYLAVSRFAVQWSDQHVVCYTDNMQAMAAVNRGTSVSKNSICIIRQMFWICAHYNIYLSALHIAGEVNLLADWLSRAGIRGFIGINHLPLCCSTGDST